ncbi:MAG: PorT family protein, partial [Prevotella sp.]|nr:PorT family protein [Prevotella sp.]
WGLSEVFKKDFHVIEQSMYPIYGTIGLSYQLK